MSLNAVEVRTEQAAIVYTRFLAPASQPPRTTPTIPKGQGLDRDYLAIGLQRDPLLHDLWNGYRATGDESANDIALMNKLAYWCNGDIDQMVDCFCCSPYASQKDDKHLKKLDREDYLKRTADRAIAGLTRTAAQDDEEYRLRNVRRDFAVQMGAQGATLPPVSFINPIATDEVLSRYTLDDIGNARLFADTFKGWLLYIPDYKAWWFYGAGAWREDNGDVMVRQCAKLLADYARSVIPLPPAPPLPGELKDALEPPAKDEWVAHRKHWAKCRFISPIKSLIQLAQDELSGRATDFDRQPYLFNCKNGTLNLHTMQLQPHNPKDMLSKQASVVYDASADCPRFTRFINEITEWNAERALMLQKALGYAMKGEANEECYFTAIGEKTRNGKGTLFDTVLHLFGSYGAQIDFDTIAKNGAKDGSRATPDLARLIGLRLILANEPDKGVFVNEALLKQITGNDDITARPLYGAPIQFKPIFKLFITANSKPNVSDDSLFTSDRIKILPFTRHFSEAERDTTLKSQLRQPEALSGILNWLLEGYKLYSKEGLKNTAEMTALVNEYRRENDYVGQYLGERITLTAEEQKRRTTVKAVRRDYDSWCSVNGIKPLGLKAFKAELTKRDIRVFIIHKQDVINGIIKAGYDYAGEQEIQRGEFL